MAMRCVASLIAIAVSGAAWANDLPERLDPCQVVRVAGRVIDRGRFDVENTRSEPSEERAGLEGADLVFVSEDGASHGTATSETGGWYEVQLRPARYRVWVTKAGYEAFTTQTGFVVVRGCERPHRFNPFLTPEGEH